MHLFNLPVNLLLFIATLTSAATSNDKILLSRVKSLTLRADQLTSSRRVKPIPQLTCVGGNARGLYDVDVMRCENSGSGFDNEDIQWTCKASLPPEFKLGSTEVACEGYSSPEDAYVLKGSCGVEYRLVLTEMGEEKYGRGSGWMGKGGDEDGWEGGSRVLDGLFKVLFWGVFLAVVGVFVYQIFIAPYRQRATNRPFPWLGGGGPGGGGGGGGGGGWPGDNNDPPPPYTPRAPKPASSYRANRATPGPSTRQQGNAWRPGFWTGAAAGAAASYAASAFTNNRNAQQARGYNYYNPDTEPGPSRRPPTASSWFNTPRQPSYGAAGPSSFGGGSFAGPSNSRQESTGFGGTRRR